MTATAAATSAREALRGLVRHPLRSGLALLGLVVGVSSVVGSLALLVASHRFAIAAVAQRSRLDVVTVESPVDILRDGRLLSVPKPVSFTADDAERLRLEVAGVRDVMPYSEDSLKVQREGIAFDVRVYGVGAAAPAFLPMETGAGRFFTPEEAETATRVAVLTRALAEDLFTVPAAAVGREVRVSGQRFYVVGVVEVPKEPFSGDDRRGCYVPYRAKEERLQRSLHNSQLLVRAASLDLVPEVREGLVRRLSRLRPGVSAANFIVGTLEDEIHAANVEAGIRGLTLGGVAVLALLVAGGGILNTLLVGVKQRTREIGTRRALGATRGAIRTQFLLEALLLAIPGAALGVGAGTLLARSLGALFASGLFDPTLLRVVVGAPEALAGVLSAVVVAVGAGVVPAWRAASVEPAEALRYE